MQWSKCYCDSQHEGSLEDLHAVIGKYLVYIHFYKIPASILMRHIHPLHIIPHKEIMNALAYQVITTNSQEALFVSLYGHKRHKLIRSPVYFVEFCIHVDLVQFMLI